jgi:uncharacterized membrane protein
MRFKARWVWKSISYRATSSLIGAAVVWYLTGSWFSSGLYALFYTPIALAWFCLHEKLWHMWKIRDRCRCCNGRGVGFNWQDIPMECRTCDGSGKRQE